MAAGKLTIIGVALALSACSSIENSSLPDEPNALDLNPSLACTDGAAGELMAGFTDKHEAAFSTLRAVDTLETDDSGERRSSAIVILGDFTDELVPLLRESSLDCAINLPTAFELLYSQGVSADAIKEIGFSERPGWSERKDQAHAEVCLGNPETSQLLRRFEDKNQGLRRGILTEIIDERPSPEGTRIDVSGRKPFSSEAAARRTPDVLELKQAFYSEFQQPAFALDRICQQAPVTFAYWFESQFPADIVSAFEGIVSDG